MGRGDGGVTLPWTDFFFSIRPRGGWGEMEAGTTAALSPCYVHASCASRFCVVLPRWKAKTQRIEL